MLSQKTMSEIQKLTGKSTLSKQFMREFDTEWTAVIKRLKNSGKKGRSRKCH